jgi:hypothetical protein
MVQVDKFCVHKLWQVQDIADVCRTHFAVLCIALLIFHERRNEAPHQKIKGQIAFQQAASQLQCRGFWGCYLIKNANLRVSRCTLCSPYVLAVS